MKELEVSLPVRGYAQLLTAVTELLRSLSTDGGEELALAKVFEATVLGFDAQKALLLSVEEEEPVRLRALQRWGKLSSEMVDACERGESVRGVSASAIREVVRTGRPVLIEDPRLQHLDLTPSLSGSHRSVLCAPILDPVRGATVAVLYFQSASLIDSYTPHDLHWLESFAAAVGQVFGLSSDHQRRTRDLEARLADREEGEDAPEILGESAHTQNLRRELHEVFLPVLEARCPEPILILGERGTGKDLVARYLHAYGARRNRPLVVANCAEIADELAASRFFGHKRGSFTGALADERGFFRAAEGGVLFLDEVSELSTRGQAHLLRVLENHAVTPVGETREVPVDVAVVLATNRDLDEAVLSGAMRADFYDRFRTLAIRLMPLRERPWDIPVLLEHFRRHHERKHRKRTLGFTPEAMRALCCHAWPGNVRDLARACALFVIHARPGAKIDRELIARCLPEILPGTSNPGAGPLLWDGLPLRTAVREFERELVLARLERHGGSARAAGESLGLSKATMYRYLKAFGATPQAAEGE